MTQEKQFGLSTVQKSDMWRRWKAGQSLHEIGRAFGKEHLLIQARGVLKKELLGHLRSRRRIGRSQHARIFRDSRGQIADPISIRERPAEVADRAIPGHWEAIS